MFLRRTQELLLISHPFWAAFTLEVYQMANSLKVEINRPNSFIALKEDSYSLDYFKHILAIWKLGHEAVLIPEGQSDRETDLALINRPCDYFLGDWNKRKNSIRYNPQINDELALELEIPNQAGLTIFTSGSTGVPKAIYHSAQSLWESVESSCQFFQLTSANNFLQVLPAHHMGGLMVCLRALYAGAPLKSSRQYDQIELIKQSDTLSLVPTQIKKIFNLALNDVELLKALQAYQLILLGGAPIDQALYQQLQEHHIPAVVSYGLSESGALILAQHPLRRNSNPQSGEVLPGRKVKIIKGHLAFGKYGRMKGQWIKGKLTPPLLSDQYFITHDLAKKEEDRFAILGRSDRIFISGGENINPLEIEDALNQVIEGDCLVLSKEDDHFGQVPIAFISASDYKNIVEIEAHLEKRLAKYKRPKYYYPLQRSSSLKIKESLQKKWLENRPKILLLHGQFGNSKDWRFVQRDLEFQGYECISSNLPKAPLDKNWGPWVSKLSQRHSHHWELMMGYSLGGRVALRLLAHENFESKKLILLSSHPGLKTQDERDQRWQWDQKMAQALRDNPKTFWRTWYNLPLWGNLKKEKDFPRLLEQREKLSSKQLAQSFLDYSPAHWPNCPLPENTNITFMTGELDKKYIQVARENTSWKVEIIKKNGHNILFQSPEKITMAALEILNS
jgi:o-succinylbenzoate---CoA ligase